MIVEAQTIIRASIEKVWAVLTDVANAAAFVRGIEKTEVVAEPPSGLVGLRWRETRILFGEPAVVEKWITDAEDGKSFSTRAESDGFVFITVNRLSSSGDGVVLASSHETRPASFVARLKALPLGLFKGTIRKAILQDLADIKVTAERHSG